jgi:hypothetical protein
MPIQSTQAKIPVLDFYLDLKPDTSSWLYVCRALEEYGCFVAEIGNKVPIELHNTISAVGGLFDFPIETKMKVTYERPFHGYSSNTRCERLVIDNATSDEVTQNLTNIFWPNGNDHFR